LSNGTFCVVFVRDGSEKLKSPNVYSKSVCGTCEQILDRTVDNRSIIQPYPECGNDIISYSDPEAEGLSYQFDLERHQELNLNATGTDDGVIISIGHPAHQPKSQFCCIFLVAFLVCSVCFVFCSMMWCVAQRVKELDRIGGLSRPKASSSTQEDNKILLMLLLLECYLILYRTGTRIHNASHEKCG
jgi:hypothetical protein